MAGIIIKNSDYTNIENMLNTIKSQIWSDQTNPEQIIIHQKEISEAMHGRTGDPIYNRFRSNYNNRVLYNGLGNIYSTNTLTVIGACICLDELNSFFPSINRDKYLIALQLLLENYCHFLNTNNGIGDIIYESRNDSEDEKMRNRFYHIKLMGSLYIDSTTMLKRLKTINFLRKTENNAGLQIADFSPNYFARHFSGKSHKRFNIDSHLRRFRYDGCLNLRSRFGVKILP